MNIDKKYMAHCLNLAKLGLGKTHPNPLVGSVLVAGGSIIGDGWHQKSGGKHAEVLAIESVKHQSLLPEATLYVTLEPCVHYGKTPPCADYIISKGIKRVVVGTNDTNPLVCGRGIEKLEHAGITVVCGVLADECREVNKRFFTYHEKKRPYIILKYAQTQDGFIDILRTERQPHVPFWITNAQSKVLTHKWRSEEQAILVGTNTVINDNPRLDVRHWHGEPPLRVAIDRTLRVPKHYNIWDDSLPTLIISEKQEHLQAKNTRIETLIFSENLPKQICDILYKNTIQSLILEGGANLLNQFIKHNLWDEARVFIGEKSIVRGLKAPVLQSEPFFETDICGDRLRYYKNTA